SWWRVIASTHFDSISGTGTSEPPLRGYGVRFVDETGAVNPNPCFECHDHELRTNTNPADGPSTIHRDWALSGHAGHLLANKIAVATDVTSGNPFPARGDAAFVVATTDAVAKASSDWPTEIASATTGLNNCSPCHLPNNFVAAVKNYNGPNATKIARFITGAAPATGSTDPGNGAGGGIAVDKSAIGSVPGAAGKGLVPCWACHADVTKGTLRTLKGAATATQIAAAQISYTSSTNGWWNNYNTSVPTTSTTNARETTAPANGGPFNGKHKYPDVGGSNLCIMCHDAAHVPEPQGAENAAATIDAAHYLNSAAIMYVKTGFISFSTAGRPLANTLASTPGGDGIIPVGVDSAVNPTYAKSLMADLDGGTITSTHRSLGTTKIITDSHNSSGFFNNNFNSNGPCVVCHYGGKGADGKASHTLSAISDSTVKGVCNQCHTSEGGHSITNAADFNTYFITPNKESFQNAIQLFVDVFNAKIGPTAGMTMTVNFNTQTLTTSTAWTSSTVVVPTGYNAIKISGAIHNVAMLLSDSGAYAHARTYTRRLLYDSIDYIDDGSMDGSVSATAVAISNTSGLASSGLFTKGAAAYADSTLTTLAPGTSESMIFLIGWNRTTGAWTSPERP
ncbi:MAG: hypothetical protein FWD70_03415, partial [Desulfuromonadales bacterium]|nr:hypothetical protein [Desulfuromonadales bacterium]